MKPTTRDQKLYRRNGGQIKAEIDVRLTREAEDAPRISECRHAILPVNNGNNGYVIYDRLLNRIVDGVYYLTESQTLDDVLKIAQYYNEFAGAFQDMSPSGDALGLKYPKVNPKKNIPILIEERSANGQDK